MSFLTNVSIGQIHSELTEAIGSLIASIIYKCPHFVTFKVTWANYIIHFSSVEELLIIAQRQLFVYSIVPILSIVKGIPTVKKMHLKKCCFDSVDYEPTMDALVSHLQELKSGDTYITKSREKTSFDFKQWMESNGMIF